MDILQETKDINKKTFLNHVFSMTDEGKAEMFNVVQYAIMGVVPIVILNKLIQRFIPEADTDRSSLEILVEILIQIIVMFCGIIIVHRVITYFPTYSGFKYDQLILTNVILAFLILVLSIQTKLGLKVNILYDRLGELWNGSDSSGGGGRKNMRISQTMGGHVPSQADYLDNSATQMDIFPPAPIAAQKPSNGSYDTMIRGSSGNQSSAAAASYAGPMAANSVLGGGGGFGSFF
jgi:hypothetical protein